MEYTLFYPTPWEQVDAENDNIDVCLTFPDDRSYTFVVATPKNLKQLMAAGGKPYLTPGVPMLIAERLTQEAVAALIAEIVNDENLMQRYGSDL